MRIKTKVAALAITLATLTVASANASVTEFTSNAAFGAAGTIVQTTNFDAYSTSTPVANPFTVGDLTFTSGDNIIVAPDLGYSNTRNLLAYNLWSPMSGTIDAAGYDLFGFDLAMLGQTSDVTLTLTTNLGSYSLGPIATINASQGLQFLGFQAGAGEYFTGFTLASAQGPGSAPGTTDFELGVAGVPEPGAWALMILGFGCVGTALRSRRRTAPALG
ncbi:PEPxxWA-CTERM sorting domain-containing protein [Phenylobacterium sp.]|uniref:PEPxxWA-CTERM sorting domain-containing protein n=1 Tax=Phenylobacterium sp. TaxID=1871053 RepID=UPI002E37230C|nr:PEPxxWA-CTERM sorting domain-containing protein [Phenylobacterium sp.]HEX4712250.1 PEPxxWA-CTERM sorting domain-containing protein [Phenylobacterium sp.]